MDKGEATFWFPPQPSRWLRLKIFLFGKLEIRRDSSCGIETVMKARRYKGQLYIKEITTNRSKQNEEV